MIPTSGQPNGQGAPLAAQNGSAGGVGGPSASPPGGSPKRMVRQRQPGTFAGMQQQGVARPSPQMVQQQAAANQQMQAQQAQAAQQQAAQPVAQPAPAPAAAPASAPAAGDVGSMLRSQIVGSLQAPGQGLAEAAQSQIARQARTLDQQFADSRANLNENLAARGLDASTIAASGLSRLAERQGQATADMVAQIEEQVNRDRGSQLQQAIANALGLNAQEQSASQFDKRLAFDANTADRNFGLQSGSLDLQRQQFGASQARDARDFAYQSGRDTSNDAWRQGQFDYQKGRDANQDTQWQKMFDYNQGVDNRNFDYRAGRDTIGDNQWRQQFDTNQNNWNKTFDFNKSQADQSQSNWDKQFTTGNEQWNKTFDWNKSNANTNGIIQLLSGMGYNNISPTMLNSIMSSLGLNPSGGGAPTNPMPVNMAPSATAYTPDGPLVEQLYGGF